MKLGLMYHSVRDAKSGRWMFSTYREASGDQMIMFTVRKDNCSQINGLPTPAWWHHTYRFAGTEWT